MKKEKLPPKEGKDDASKNFVEITVPDVSGIKEKVDSALDKVGERVIEKGIMDRFSDDMALMFEKDRVGLDPSYARMGISIAVASIVMVALMLYAGAPLWIFGFLAFMLLLCVALVFLGKYEIRYDPDGFSVRLGKKEHRRYAWTDITDVQDGKKVFVKGKRLFADRLCPLRDHDLSELFTVGKGVLPDLLQVFRHHGIVVDPHFDHADTDSSSHQRTGRDSQPQTDETEACG
jgi:hypothetical protein